MRVLRSRVNPRDPTFQENAADNGAACERLEQELAKSLEGGGERYVKRHLDRDKLLPRERIEKLLDPDSWFLELSPLAGRDVDLIKPGAGIVGGVGLISGVECMVTASEATVQGGAVNEIGMWKTRRLAEISIENRLPSISLIEECSSGASP